MPALAIVDDRAESRGTLKSSIDLRLRSNKNWVSLDTYPLPTLLDYPSWIAENDVSVLILDERLNEAIQQGDTLIGPVGYEGHDLVDFLRESFDTIPIFVITAHKDDDNLQKRFPAVEDIFSRIEFSQKADELMPRIIRAGTKFYEDNQIELKRLAYLSRKIAQGEASEDEIAEVSGLQMSRSLPLRTLLERGQWLSSLDTTISEFESLNARMREFLQHEMDQNF